MRKLATVTATICAAAIALSVLSDASGIDETGLEIVSISSTGELGTSGSIRSSINGSGRYVGFESDASNLVENDINSRDVFLHDRLTGTATLVSIATDGTQANRPAINAAVSADGRYVAFDSRSDTLAPNTDQEWSDVYIRDVVSGTTELVSVALDGSPGNGHSELPSISADGRYVAFTSTADNLVPNDDNGERDVFIRDRELGVTELVSISTEGVQGDATSGHIQAGQSQMSADGRFVVFGSFATNLVSNDTNQADDIFIRDHLLGTTERVSVSSDGTEGDGHSMRPDVSDDGRFVVFDSLATNLFPQDTLAAHVFVHDRENGTTTPLSLAHDGGVPDGSSNFAAISGDGRWIAFASQASNLVPGVTNGAADVYLYDTQTGTLERASVSDDGAEGDSSSTMPDLSTTGVLAFHSHATNLVPGDDNGVTDVFVLGKRLRAPTPVPTATAPQPTATPVPPTPTAAPTGPVGDADCSGTVNAIDAALVLQFIAGLLVTLPCPDAADANQDGQINAIDAALILQLTAGFFESLPP